MWDHAECPLRVLRLTMSTVDAAAAAAYSAAFLEQISAAAFLTLPLLPPEAIIVCFSFAIVFRGDLWRPAEICQIVAGLLNFELGTSRVK